eukprot:TRINITY_DN13988_c0_g1_i1.p1 TRINITY_DN13988_c0_g1~~TRINITY_DN13988_c0_g1_i1.p1  ORF type:complete len:118 (+),score=8.51 TRINITY_DN13988_c0_g1_i1:232-585(+)
MMPEGKGPKQPRAAEKGHGNGVQWQHCLLIVSVITTSSHDRNETMTAATNNNRESLFLASSSCAYQNSNMSTCECRCKGHQSALTQEYTMAEIQNLPFISHVTRPDGLEGVREISVD